jgi:uncharacterized protein YdeI (BOF family)
MRKLVLIALATAVGLLAQAPAGRAGRMGFGGQGFMGPGGAQATVAGAPYSAVEVSTTQQVLAGGNAIQIQRQSNVFRDSQGRVRTEVAAGSKTSNTLITIHDPVAGVMRRVDTQNRVVTEIPIHAGGSAFRANGNGSARNGAAPGQHAMAGRGPGARRAADPNVTTEDLGQQTINGVAATGHRITRTIPAGAMGNAQPIQSVREVWTSTDLKVPVLVKTSDPRRGTTVTQLTNISRAEPDAALFQAPAGYTVRQGAAARPMGRGQRGQQ